MLPSGVWITSYVSTFFFRINCCSACCHESTVSKFRIRNMKAFSSSKPLSDLTLLLHSRHCHLLYFCPISHVYSRVWRWSVAVAMEPVDAWAALNRSGWVLHLSYYWWNTLKKQQQQHSSVHQEAAGPSAINAGERSKRWSRCKREAMKAPLPQGRTKFQ